MLTETMKFITVNPTWNVPPSIIYNEYLPALQQDPTVLDRMGLKLDAERADGSVRISRSRRAKPTRSAASASTSRTSSSSISTTRRTSTCSPSEERAFSHGCMRVQNPDQYAANLLSIALPEGGLHAEKIRRCMAATRSNINFPTPIPVNITYQTAFVDERRQAAIPQGHLRPRRGKVMSMLKRRRRPRHGGRRLARPAELRPPDQCAGARRQLRQQQRARTSSNGCSARRHPAAGPAPWPAPGGPLGRSFENELDFRFSRFKGLRRSAGPFSLTIAPKAFPPWSAHRPFFAILRAAYFTLHEPVTHFAIDLDRAELLDFGPVEDLGKDLGTFT
jgi:hypothetical protein